MDYSKIKCQAINRDFKADKILKVRNEDCLENVVSICYSCPYSDSKRDECKNCYGTIVQNVIKKINKDTGRVKMEVTNIKNNFLRVGGQIMKMMEADEFIDNIEVIANLNSANWNHGQRVDDHLRAYDRNKTWKTDCADCKNRCAKNNTIPACEKAKKYMEENGINLMNDSDKKILSVELPEECICKEQTQMLYFV